MGFLPFPMSMIGKGAAGGGGGATTWNLTDNSSIITRSNGNLTATEGGSASGSGDGLRATTSRSSGKLYFEITLTTDVSAQESMGIAKSTASLVSNSLGADADGWGIIIGSGGALVNNGAPVQFGGAGDAGDVYGFAVDLTGLLLYVSKNGSFLFSGNPTVGSGGTTIAAGSWFPAASLFGSGDVVTLNVGTTAFNTSPPSGYSAWG